MRYRILLLLGLIAWLYTGILVRLFSQLINDQYSSHGLLVPFFASFVLWANRDRLKQVRLSPSWTGLPLVILALALLVLGVLGVELFTSRASLLILIAGLIILLWGTCLFRAVLFPWALLFLMMPIPAIIIQQVTFPLQLFASKLAATVLWNLFNVPTFRDGNVIVLPQMQLQVVEACSGIRSLVSLLTLAVIYGYLLEKRNWVRILLVAASVPVAISANVLRIVLTGLLGQHHPELAEGFYHEFQGLIVFVLALIMLSLVHRALEWIWPTRSIGGESRAMQESIPAYETRATRSWSPQFVVPALLMLTTALGLQVSQRELLPARQPLSALPSQVDDWTSKESPLDQDTREILGHGEFLWRIYSDAGEQQPDIDLFVAYYPTQKFGDTPHTPLHCLVGAGFIPIVREVVELKGPHGLFPVNRWIAAHGDQRNLVLYWFQAHGRQTTSEYSAKYYLIRDAIRLHRSDGALIRLITPMYKGESPDSAQERMMQVGTHFLSPLDQSIPP